jgi:hypothetical protein
MAEHLSKDEFHAHIGPIRDDIKEIVQLQREQNGRVHTLENKVSVLSWAYGVAAAAAGAVVAKLTGQNG